MKSIHRRLQQLMLAGLIATSAVVSVMVYFQARHELGELYDGHLKQIASLISALPQQVGIDHIRSKFHVDASDFADWEEEDFLIQVWSKDGQLVYSQPQLDAAYVLPLQAKEGGYRIASAGMEWNVYRDDGEHYNIQVAQPESPRASTIRETSLYLLIPLLLQIPALAFIVSITTRKGLAPLDTLSQAVRSRHQWSLDALPVDRIPDELQPLVQALNQLLAQLKTVLDQQRNLLSDAAHELRTPLTALRLQIDAYHRADGDREREECVSALDRGVARSSSMVSQLLLFARSEARALSMPVSEMTLEQIASEALARQLPMARVRRIDLGIARLSNTSVRVVASDVEAVIDNLISNAINYSPDASRVDVSLEADDDHFTIEVLDEGKGIPHGERERVFDRFYRVTNSSAGGSGLGLAIVRAICERNGATVSIHDSATGIGTLFRVLWPRWTTPDSAVAAAG